MTQDENPAPAAAAEEQAVVEHVPPAPPRPAAAKHARVPAAYAADPFAVGVRVLKMAPAWLLVTTVCCTLLVLTLGWMKAGGGAVAVALSPKRNDARAAKTAPAPRVTAAKAEAGGPAHAAPPAKGSGRTTAANDAPAQAPAQPETRPAPAAQPAPPAPAKVEETPRSEPPAAAEDSGAKFTAQVGSFRSLSEANEHVSRLRAAGFDSRASAAELNGRGTWYRVQVGRFADRAEAAKAVASLRAKGAGAGAIVVPVQN